MRCYFHLSGPEEDIADTVGVEVVSLDEARTEALKAIAELRREEPLLQRDWNGWQLRIVDAAGKTLSTIHLSLTAPIMEQHAMRRAALKEPPADRSPKH